MSSNQSEMHIQTWLKEAIIDLNLCPFAKLPYEKGLIRIQGTKIKSFDEQVHFFLDEINIIQVKTKDEISNSLIYFENFEGDFLDFNDFVGVCEELLTELNLDDIFQLVCFHPDFIFDETDANERINLVNRSPYPLIHILRFEEVEMALKSSDEALKINARNESTLKTLSPKRCQDLFRTYTASKK